MAQAKRFGGRPLSSTPTSKSASLLRQKESSVSRNVSGYKKRHERKDKSGQLDDLYEYTASKNKRAHVELHVDRDELASQGPSKNALEDNDEIDSDTETLRRKISANMNGEFGVVDSDDDEDIDSDEAFEGESDEERFDNFKFAEKVRPL